MSTFAAYCRRDGKQLCLWVTIQGIETVFAERVLSLTSILGEARTVVAAITSGGVEHGESMLDLEKHRQVNGSLRVRLRQRHGATTLTDTFRAMRRRRTYLTADVTKTSTTFSVASTAAFPSSGVFFAGAETIAYAGKTSTTFTGCSRAKFGSRAQSHLGNSGEGTAIYDSAPAFLGRRVSLYGSFLLPSGRTTAALTRKIGTFVIEEPPEFADDRTVEINAGPLIDEYLTKKLYVGARDLDVEAVGFDVADVNIIGLATEPNESIHVSASGSDHALVTDEAGDCSIHRISEVLSEGRTVKLHRAREVMTFVPSAVTAQVKKVKQIAFTGDLVALLCSRLGDGANGTHDILPGIERAAFTASTGFQLGAGIDEDDVDVDAFPLVQSGYLLDDTATVADPVTEAAILAESFAYVTSEGKLSFKRISPTGETPTVTIDETVLSAQPPPRVYVDEGSIFPVVTIKANWHPGRREYLYTQTHVDGELMQRYPTFQEAKVFEFKSLGVATASLISRAGFWSQEQVAELARHLQRSDDAGRLIVTVSCSIALLLVDLGDAVNINFDAPNHRGGTIRGSVGRVIGKRPRFDAGTVELTLHVLERLFVFAPASVIAGTAVFGGGTGTTITLSTTDACNTSAPGDAFAVGQSVKIVDVSAATTQTRTIQSLTSTSMVVAPAVSGSPELDVDFVTVDDVGANDGTSASASGHTEADHFFFEEEPVDDADDDDVRRWR